LIVVATAQMLRSLVSTEVRMPRNLLCGKVRAARRITGSTARGTAALLGLAIAASGLALWVRWHRDAAPYPLEHEAQFSVVG
jgi:hypothetical protein